MSREKSAPFSEESGTHAHFPRQISSQTFDSQDRDSQACGTAG
jgi:hypothetical protein